MVSGGEESGICTCQRAAGFSAGSTPAASTDLVLLQILGTNAAGKSTVLRTLVEMGAQGGVEFKGLTALPNLGMLLIGNYADPTLRTPGADRIHTKAELLTLLDLAALLGRASGYWAIAWEGILLQTRAYYLEALNRQLLPAYGYLTIPESLAFERIQGRSGKRREDLSGSGAVVVNRARQVKRLGAWLAAQPRALAEEWDGTLSPQELATNALRLAQRRLYY